MKKVVSAPGYAEWGCDDSSKMWQILREMQNWPWDEL